MPESETAFGRAFGSVMGAGTAMLLVLAILVGAPTLLCCGGYGFMVVLVATHPQN